MRARIWEQRAAVKLLIPSLALIAATTMIPVGLRRPSFRIIDFRFFLFDLVNNILLYVPFGFLLARHSFRRTVGAGFGLSVIAETLQMGYVSRSPAPADVIGNTAGTLLGYLLGRLVLRMGGRIPAEIRIRRWLLALALPVAIGGSISIVRHGRPSDFSNWDGSFHLMVGDEVTGKRPWHGTISGLRIYARVLPREEIEAAVPGAEADADYQAKPGRPDYGKPLLKPQQEGVLFQRIKKAGRLSVLIWIKPDSLVQLGPARIVTYARDQNNHNFMLGQNGESLIFALRTPETGFNGLNPALYTPPVLKEEKETFVAATYDGRVSRLYVDGKLSSQAELDVKRPHLSPRVLKIMPSWLPLRDAEAIFWEVAMGALMAAGILGCLGVPGQWQKRMLIGMIGGAAVGSFIWIFGVSDTRLGLGILLECVASGMAAGFGISP